MSSDKTNGDKTVRELADSEIDPETYTDQVVLVRSIRRRIEEAPGKSRWTLTRAQLGGLLSLIETLSGDE